MKILSYCIMLLTVFSSCSIVKPQSDSPKLDGFKWQLIALKQKPVSVDGGNAFIQFDKKEKVTGKAACNSFFGAYELIGKNQLTFSDMGSTKMFCDGIMDIESEMINGLKDTKKYEVKADMLYLYSSGELVLTFKR